MEHFTFCKDNIIIWPMCVSSDVLGWLVVSWVCMCALSQVPSWQTVVSGQALSNGCLNSGRGEKGSAGNPPVHTDTVASHLSLPSPKEKRSPQRRTAEGAQFEGKKGSLLASCFIFRILIGSLLFVFTSVREENKKKTRSSSGKAK